MGGGQGPLDPDPRFGLLDLAGRRQRCRQQDQDRGKCQRRRTLMVVHDHGLGSSSHRVGSGSSPIVSGEGSYVCDVDHERRIAPTPLSRDLAGCLGGCREIAPDTLRAIDKSPKTRYPGSAPWTLKRVSKGARQRLMPEGSGPRRPYARRDGSLPRPHLLDLFPLEEGAMIVPVHPPHEDPHEA